MTNDEKYVRGAFGYVVGEWGRTYPGHVNATFHLKLPIIWREGLNVMFALTPEAAWSAAARFTESRAEEIRQVLREIEVLSKLASWMGSPGCVASECRDEVTVNRSIKRLHSTLATLENGLKQEFLAALKGGK